jgi:hypothetical protein
MLVRSVLLRSLTPTRLMSAVALMLLSSILAAAQAPDAAAHLQWMDDASDAQDDVRVALTGKDAKAAAEALDKLDALMARTDAYWTAKGAADGAALAKDARSQAGRAAVAARAGNLVSTSEAFDKMGASCNACHDLHLEKRR